MAERTGTDGAGNPAFCAKIGVGTVLADRKPVEEFAKQLYVCETGLRADRPIIKAGTPTRPAT